MYKVFINDKLICFTNKIDNYKPSNSLILSSFSSKIIPFVLELLNNCDKTQVVFFQFDNYESVFVEFQACFKNIKAAGGLVSNNKDEKLFIYRLNKWDLPKGKIENNETIELAAVREVEEECGVSSLNIIKQLEDTFHIYKLKDNLVLKQTHWFEMESSYDGELIPQIEEGITEVKWLKENEVREKILDNTYSSINELLSLNGY